MPTTTPSAADHQISPLTGWTRSHWTALADRTLRAVRPFASDGHALLALPGPASRSGTRSDGLEGFARTMLAAGFRISGDPSSPEAIEHAEWYARGLVCGTDPHSIESWPRLGETHQGRVEAASIAIALHESRALIWDQLPSSDQEKVLAWLGHAVSVQYPGNNWLWFQNVVQAFLASVGAPTDRAEVDRNLAAMEEWYAGDGWYTDGIFPSGDGERRAFDYYSGWAMQVYPLLYSRILGPQADLARVETDRERLRHYLEHAQHLIGTDGGPVYHGRSLTYRFAVLGPFWLGTLFDATPLSPGRTRRLASGVLRHFADRGAWDAHDLQSIGWHQEFHPIRQWYSGPGSPYWSSKGFAGLALPADHPVWTAAEEPLELEQGDVARSWPEPGWLLSATRDDGVVRLLNHGSDHQPATVLGLDETTYGRLSYSSATAPDSGLAAETSPVDSCIALVDSTGRVGHRRPIHRVAQAESWAVSRHQTHWLVGPARDSWQKEADPRPDEFDLGPWLTVASAVRGPVEVRLARADQTTPPIDTGLHWWFGGYPLAAADPPAIDPPAIDLPSATSVSARVSVPSPRPLTSAVVGLGDDWTAEVQRSEGRNAFGRHAAVPVLRGTTAVCGGEVVAAVVVLAGRWDADSALPTVSTNQDSGVVTVTWPDGSVDRVPLHVARKEKDE